MQSKKIISGLDVMKFIMALFIVNIHLKPTMYAPEVVQHVVGTLSGLAVPLFFVISSFLLFRKVNMGGGGGVHKVNGKLLSNSLSGCYCFMDSGASLGVR